MQLDRLLLLFGLGLASACGGKTASPDLADPGDLSGVVDDGAPVRTRCTDTYGHAITTAYGRLDGTLVAVVTPGHHGCNGDADHLHLQVNADGAVYDIAVNVADTTSAPVQYLAFDHAPLGDAWSAGWHTDVTLDYPTVGYHSTDFTSTPSQALAEAVESELADANHISVYATGYSDGTGAHEVHRNGGGMDGALVLKPLSATARVLFFHFVTQTF